MTNINNAYAIGSAFAHDKYIRYYNPQEQVTWHLTNFQVFIQYVSRTLKCSVTRLFLSPLQPCLAR